MPKVNPARSQIRSTVQRRATEVFGSYQRAERWLNKPKRQLGGATPLQAAQSADGSRQIVEWLGRIEHGVP